MDGVELHDLKIINHKKGDILHGIKSSSEGFNSFGEAYFTKIKPGEIKGWKKHNLMTLNLIVPLGDVKFVVYDGKDFFSTDLSLQNNYKRLTISPGLWVAFKGLSESTSLVLNVADMEHDSKESQNIDLTELIYEW